ncbi:FxsA family protein [Microbispora catharanthi]|uniref:FxsA family protein n=1 Tax=Microbispora catharanthi TaxID=1712871 RepID=A0A5N6C2Z3_9ACTN|nr:FxsA family protein [Microbispora catharanthi]KAB8187158.1 FxsA family protein [Microbispora catharanthi]
MVRIGLFLGFLLVPILEIWILIRVGSAIGGWETVALLIADSILGAWLVRREGRRAWAALRTAIESGRMPDRELTDGALIVAGGALLLAPGFLTDVFGFFMILPFTRPIARRWLSWFLGRRVRSLAARSPYAPLFERTAGFDEGAGFGGAGGFGGPAGANRGRVVHGEVIDDD